MSQLITVAPGFQYSVNIGYDLNNDQKIKDFIPTVSACGIIKDILLSTSETSSQRSRILIGPYGKGKSHLMLVILSMLMKKDKSLFFRITDKENQDPELIQLIDNYYDSENKILPVVITGSSLGLAQSLLLALQRTLAEHDLLSLMPNTSFKAALNTISLWKEEYPETYKEFFKKIDLSEQEYLSNLEEFDIQAYRQFETLYPKLTSGSIFNPLLGFEVADVYEEAARGLKKLGYTGIYIVYDEFSKYLESNAETTSLSDMKTLQDLAEKCCRSGSLQLHLMLISHKDITSYLDKLPKQKIDGWRGVSDRFLHTYFTNNFNQTYEIIESVIQKNPVEWDDFCNSNQALFNELEKQYSGVNTFSDLSPQEVNQVIYGCYPLHPASTFILPRLSERVAQNERTLFTFLSSDEASTLKAFLKRKKDDNFELITPDAIYDYFEPLLRKELYSSQLHDTYILTQTVVEQLEGKDLEIKLVKGLSLIYLLGQFEKLPPDQNTLFGMFSSQYSHTELAEALQDLCEGNLLIYQKLSNGYLQLKQSSGINVLEKLSDASITSYIRDTTEMILDELSHEKYLYPSRYNDDHDMIRYFSFHFISAEDALNQDSLQAYINRSQSDGVIFNVVLNRDDDPDEIKEKLLSVSSDLERSLFILPKRFKDIDEQSRQLKTANMLRKRYSDNAAVLNELDIIIDDLNEVLTDFEAQYIHPEDHRAHFIESGFLKSVNRKSALTEVLSQICDRAFPDTPRINNEALNRNEATGIARNSRSKLITALLREHLEPNLGLHGTGQDVSIMRSTLVRTGILKNHETIPELTLQPENNEKMADLLKIIEDFLLNSENNESRSFKDLYEMIGSLNSSIALRRELIPLYLAVVLHLHSKEVLISDSKGAMPLTLDTVMLIHNAPEKYTVSRISWNEEQTALVQSLEELYSDFILEAERTNGSFDYLRFAMKRWYYSLPRYSRETKTSGFTDKLPADYIGFLKLIHQEIPSYTLLFKSIPNLFSKFETVADKVNRIHEIRNFYDTKIQDTSDSLILWLKEIFDPSGIDNEQPLPLLQILQNWLDKLDPTVGQQVFNNGTNAFLDLIAKQEKDEFKLIHDMAFICTDLSLENWNDLTYKTFENAVHIYKNTAESYEQKSAPSQVNEDAKDYQIVFIGPDGQSSTKRFERVDVSGRAALLQSRILSDLDMFGQSITDAEKRQVLMEALQSIC